MFGYLFIVFCFVLLSYLFVVGFLLFFLSCQGLYVCCVFTVGSVRA